MNQSVNASQAANLDQIMNELKQLDVTRREKAADSLRADRQRLLDELTKMLDEGDAPESFARMATAAELLGDFRAIEAIPSLCDRIAFEVPVFVFSSQEFYFEGCPCANAIRSMGPSALKPTLEALAIRRTPLSANECRAAAYVIASLCDDSKEDALKAIQKTQEKFPESKNLHPIHLQIEHFMDFHKNVERQHAPPSA